MCSSNGHGTDDQRLHEPKHQRTKTSKWDIWLNPGGNPPRGPRGNGHPKPKRKDT